MDIKKENKVSEPVLSHSGGWFRYNYEKEQLEFINQETKAVTFTRDIPKDQWEILPSQHDYCQQIVDEANAEIAAKQKSAKRQIIIALIPIIVVIVVALWLIFVHPHNSRKENAISIAKTHTSYLGGKNYEHAGDYKGYCIISFDVYGNKYYFAADNDSYINAPADSINELKSSIDRVG